MQRTIPVNNGFGFQNIQLSWTKPGLGAGQPWFSRVPRLVLE